MLFNVKTFIISLLSLIMPIKPILLLVGILIMADTATGIWKSLKKGEGITSNRLSHTISKLVLYYLVIILGFWIDTHIFMLYITNIISIYIAITEFVSVCENAGEITGEPIFKKLINLLKKKSANTIENIIKKEDEI